MTQHAKVHHGSSLIDSFVTLTHHWVESFKAAYAEHKAIRIVEQELSSYSDGDLLSLGMSRVQIREAVKIK